MKFSHFIHYNIIPEWSNYYLPYSDLKSLIYKELTEQTPLLSTKDNHALFIQTLDQSLSKITQFYREKETEFLNELDLISIQDISEEMDEHSTAETSITVVDDQRLIQLYIHFSLLKSFVHVNETCFTKILKKYDACVNAKLHLSYMHRLSLAYPFQTSTRRHLDACLHQITQRYGHKEDLDQFVRNYIKNHQNTQTSPPLWNTKQAAFLALSVLVFLCLLKVPFFEHIEQRQCFAILVFSSILWATELMPLFVTALLIPFLAITLRVVRVNGVRVSAMDASKVIFASMLSPVIMLLLGGFAIAAALEKYGISRGVASFVVSKAGTKPASVLFVHMLVASLASMWISNVAAPVLCISLIQPVLRSLPDTSPFAPCLIMGIALASNLGGIASPIASPQNVIALQNMSPPPSWADWLSVSVPLCLVGNCIVWLWLLAYYRIQHVHVHPMPVVEKDTFSPVHLYIVGITLLTIVLWCIAHTFRDTLGDMGVIAIIPLVAFFGTGVLTKDEFNTFLWNVIVLAMGGIALGKAVESSGLLFTIASHISQQVTELSTFHVLFVFSSLVFIIATFISHTVAAVIVLPIVAKIGTQLKDPDPRILVMGTAFVCSAAMGLPVSGFPNMTAISQENKSGKPYLKTKDFLLIGVPCSILIMLSIVLVGYPLMELVGI